MFSVRNGSDTKFIFVTGGVSSSVGKGSTASSLGHLMKNSGISVAMQKMDAYININPGMMSPLQHGEVFVTADGGESDLDLGIYERFIDENLSSYSVITTGQLYKTIINKERLGEYNGRTVQVIPHVTDEIKKALYRCANESEAEILIVEIGGTVGDIEIQPYLEAARQMRLEHKKENTMFIHVTLLPYISAADELKTKPTQNSVKQLRLFGIQPDMIVCRSEKPIHDDLKRKIALFCNVKPERIIGNFDVEPIYELPLQLQSENFAHIACDFLGLEYKEKTQDPWEKLLINYRKCTDRIKVALVGKYIDLHDAYLSVVEAITHAAVSQNCKIDIKWIYSGDITSDCVASEVFANIDAIIVPAGFGERGFEGMQKSAKYARENNIPFLGIGAGMQMAIIDYAKNVIGLDADSTEIEPRTQNPIITMMEERKPDGTMRLGNYAIELKKGTILEKLYNKSTVEERHRNRYEINPDYENALQSAGMTLSARTSKQNFVEAIELAKEVHTYFIGVLYHAEFSSRLERPHPVFIGLVEAAMNRVKSV